MKKKLRLLLLGLLVITCQEKKENNEFVVREISLLIDSLFVVDQKVQSDIQEAAKNGENDKLQELFLKQNEIFTTHIPFLKDIYAKIGYPTIELVGKENSSKFFTLVQHADSDVEFQEKMLNEITKEVKNGSVSGKNYAFLTDRVQLALQKPQIYGTQLDYNTTIGQAFPKNLLDSVNVNNRRKEIGLEPIEEYLNQVTKMHFEMNKSHYDTIGVKEPRLYEVK